MEGEKQKVGEGQLAEGKSAPRTSNAFSGYRSSPGRRWGYRDRDGQGGSGCIQLSPFIKPLGRREVAV